MSKEKRHHRRVKPEGLQADIIFNSNNRNQEIIVDADIIDISYSGIRVKLKNPIAFAFNGRIKINMTLPESGSPFSVHGILKHQQTDTVCGVHYVDHVEGSIDDLMFECLELENSIVFIKTI